MQQLIATVEGFFSDLEAVAGDGIVVAFSGGGDSLALLYALSRVARRQHFRLHAAHLDHGLDHGSRARADSAVKLAQQLGVDCTCERRNVVREARPGTSPEAAAREVRYRFLEAVRRRLEARFIATAHHRDDQAETVLLRLLFGSGLEGLAGIRRRQGAVVRPLLDLSRERLGAARESVGLIGLVDPTNADRRFPRSRIRRDLLPHLSPDGELARTLGAVAASAEGANRRIEAHLEDALAPVEQARRIAIRRRDLERLPAELVAPALAFLHRRAGAPYPAGLAPRRELLRQLRSGRRVGCDCGSGWRWEEAEDRLVLRRARPPTPVFTYTLVVPGMVDIPEISLGFRLRRGPAGELTSRRSLYRARLTLCLRDGDRVTIRNRRPGDRIRPLGSPRTRRLKDVLTRHRVPVEARQRLPLLSLGGHIVWVPGVTIDHRFRADTGEPVWLAEVVDLEENRYDPSR